MTLRGLVFTSVSSFVAFACGSSAPPVETHSPPPPAPAAPVYDGLTRAEFNQRAVRLNLPVFWVGDANSNGAVDPNEVASLLFYPTEPTWVRNGQFTPEFAAAYQAMIAEANWESSVPAADAGRLRLMREELDAGAVTIVQSDFSSLAEWEKNFVRHMLLAAEVIDSLYEMQNGTVGLIDRIAADDHASRSLFRRNWGPRCESPRLESNEACTAITGVTRVPSGIYPADIQSDGFCAQLEARPRSADLMAPFVVVQASGDALTAVPYTVAYQEPMARVAAELRAAAAGIPEGQEDALRAYLLAAAQSFEDNDWVRADEAWAAMNAHNSAWYLRIGPDETYFEPCSHKGGFHLTLARINRASLEWQQRLSPLQQEMEQLMAERAGRPYRAREVHFDLPDFIDIVINSGDDRSAFGATVGQSLPNWGKVADESRGRTVVMSNLYTDDDSMRVRREKAAMVLTQEAFSGLSDESGPGLMSTILHEACHNLGPAQGYRYRGKTSEQGLGGGLASMFEELKAQTGGLFLVQLLVERGVIDAATANQTYLDSILWALGHVSRGMYTPTGQRKAYSQLSAIQIGFLMEHGALRWDPAVPAANGTDTGAFAIDYAKVPEAIRELMGVVASIKATNDRARGEELAARYVDSAVVPQQVLADRYNRVPKQSFVYSINF